MISALSKAIQFVRTSVGPEDSEPTDGQLLERFVCQRETPALDVLVRRHGPMVWGVCRRVLGDHHDAEDAFQATFLVLVRRADSIVPRDMVGNWLYGVAQQTARKARATAAKRAGRERHVPNAPEPTAAEKNSPDDIRPVLDQELSRLPDKYRAAVVLCDLEGKTRDEAARQLCLPEGTVASRLARGRALLANRLAGRGVTLSAAALATTLVHNTASAVPAALLTKTLVSLPLAATAATTASASVTALAESVGNSIGLTKLRMAIVGALVVLVAGGLAVGLLAQAKPPDDESLPGEKQIARRILSDAERIRGEWKVARVTFREEVITFEGDKGIVYNFADKKLTVTNKSLPREIGKPMGRARFGGPPAWLGVDAVKEVLGNFRGSGGPWLGSDPQTRAVLLDHIEKTEDGSIRIEFGVRLDEQSKSIDRFLTVNGEEKLAVRSVYAIDEETLILWEAAPMSPRPSREQIAAGDCTTWIFVRRTHRTP